MGDHIDETVAVTPLVVVPRDDFYHIIRYDLCQIRNIDGAVGAGDEVAGDALVIVDQDQIFE
jgi:hypothetical protein